MVEARPEKSSHISTRIFNARKKLVKYKSRVKLVLRAPRRARFQGELVKLPFDIYEIALVMRNNN